MKTSITMLVFLMLTITCFSQAPQAFNYSAVVRNGSGAPIPNQNVKFRLSILRGTITGPSVYVETQATTTDANGMVNLEIGRGTIISGVFANIPWSNDAFFLQVEIDPTGGNTFQLMGTTQFLSVPFALSAKYAENIASQFLLSHDIDTIVLFKDRSLDYYDITNRAYHIIRYFGGSMEGFTFNTASIPPGITLSPMSQSFQVSDLKHHSEFNIGQLLTADASIAAGFYLVNTNLTTASNKVISDSFTIRILDDCFADDRIPTSLTTDTTIMVGHGGNCGSNAYQNTSATIINTNPSDCSFKIKLNRYNLIFDCAIQQDKIIITGSSTIGPISGLGETVDSIAINGGSGSLVFDYSVRPFKVKGMNLVFNCTINYTITRSGFGCLPLGTYTLNTSNGIPISISW